MVGEGVRAPRSWPRPCAPTGALVAERVVEVVVLVEGLLGSKAHRPRCHYCQQPKPFFRNEGGRLILAATL